MSGNRRRFLGSVLVLSALVSAPSSALAQPPVAQPSVAQPPVSPATDAARADALFQEGKVLMEQSRFDEACARLAQSDAIDPTVSTIGLLAGCHEQQGRIATAWREYQLTVKRAEAANDNRADFARERVAALEPLLPKLLIRLVSPSPDIEILRNLERIPAAELGLEVPVDPGAYEIVARAPRRQEVRMTITAREGAKVVVDVPDLKGASADGVAFAPSPRPPPSVSAPMKEASERKPRPKAPPTEEAGTSDSTRLSAAAVAGVVGVAGLGIGAMFGISAISKSNESTIIQATCQGADCDKGRELREGAYTASTASTVAFAVGAAGLGVGLVLLLLPSSKEAAPEARTSSFVRIAPVASCNDCVAMNCSVERAACDQDPQCMALYGTCLLNTHPCCKANGLQPGGPKAEAFYQCLRTKCERTCQVESPTCADCMKNSPEETDVDCGGDLCNPCKSGKACIFDNDCASLLCVPGSCATGKCCQ